MNAQIKRNDKLNHINLFVNARVKLIPFILY